MCNPELISSASTVIAACIVVWGGIWAYFRQKEYELVKQRYLDEGIDLLVGAAEASLNTFHSNWARCFQLVEQYKDNPNFDTKELTRGFLKLSPDRWALTANYRVNKLVGEIDVWRAFQVVMAFSDYGCGITSSEIPEAIKDNMGLDDKRRQKIAEKMTEQLSSLDEKANKHHLYIEMMQQIAAALEVRRFSFKKLESFRKSGDVVQALSTIKDEYKDEIMQKAAT